MRELWRDIPGYEQLYQVSNYGNVRGKDRTCQSKKGVIRFVPGKELSKTIDKGGYLRVTLTKNAKSKLIPIHRLVMLAFVGPSDLTVNHKDENKTNNMLSNLEYVTMQENLRFGTRAKRSNKDRQKPVECYDLKTGETVNRFDGVNATKEFGFRPQEVSACCSGKCKSHYGYGWRYSIDDGEQKCHNI